MGLILLDKPLFIIEPPARQSCADLRWSIAFDVVDVVTHIQLWFNHYAKQTKCVTIIIPSVQHAKMLFCAIETHAVLPVTFVHSVLQQRKLFLDHGVARESFKICERGEAFMIHSVHLLGKN